MVMWWAFLLMVAMAATGWVFYHYYWSLRIPQDRTLSTSLGQTLQVHIEGRSPSFLLVTEPGSDAPILVPISRLSPADVDFAVRLPVDASFDYPIRDLLTDTQGNRMVGQIEGRTDSLVEFTSDTDKIARWIPLAGLSALDQAALGYLPENLTPSYPFRVNFTGPAGEKIPVSVEGRSDSMVKYAREDDGKNVIEPIAKLADADQVLVQALPQSMAVQYPVQANFTEADGTPYPVMITGRNDQLVQFSRVDTNKNTLLPITKLAAVDQAFVRTLPSSLTISYPIERDLTDARGRVMQVRIEGRSDTVVKITLAEDQSTHFYPIASLSSDDQDFVRGLPVSLTMDYPITCVLTDQQGRGRQVQIVGRTTDTVRFTRAEGGQTYEFPIAKLAAADQAYVQLLPVNLEAASPARPPEPVEVQNMRDRLAQLRDEISDYKARIASSTDQSTQTEAWQGEIDNREIEADGLMMKISTEMAEISNDSPAVSGLRQQLADEQEEINGLERKATDPRAGFVNVSPTGARTQVTPRESVQGSLEDAQEQMLATFDQLTAAGG
jgi:hypothetical protein